MAESNSEFVKQRDDAPRAFFAAEAAGLRWLADAEPLGGARIARVRWFDDHGIRLERVPTAVPAVQGAQEFGRALAVTHAAGASAFGVGPDAGPGVAFIGRQKLTLGECQCWGSFYGELRLAPYARAALDVAVAGRLAGAGRPAPAAPAAGARGDPWPRVRP